MPDARGPNEFLHVATAERLARVVADVLTKVPSAADDSAR